MGKIENVMKYEIARLARKEARKMVKPLKERIVQMGRDLSELKKQQKEHEKALKNASLKFDKLYSPDVLLSAETGEAAKSRLSPGLIKKLRKKLKITQASLAHLVDVSVNTIVNWEKGRTEPDEEAKSRIVALRDYTKTEVRAMLDQ